MKEGDKVCKPCGTVAIDAKEEEKCRICGRKMEPYKKEEVKAERP